MSNLAQDVTVRGNQVNPLMYTKHESHYRQDTTKECSSPRRSWKRNGSTEPLRQGGGAELHPSHDWAIGSSLETIRPTLAGWIYA